MSNNLKDLVTRAAWTFAQAFLAFYLILPNPDFSKATLMAAVGAGLSALKTFIVAHVRS